MIYARFLHGYSNEFQARVWQQKSLFVPLLQVDPVGILRDGAEVAEFKPPSAAAGEPGSTIYAPSSGFPVLTTFDISKEDFEVAAYIDLASPGATIPSSFGDPYLPTFNGPSLFSGIDPELVDLYDINESASAEGKATGINSNGFAESFYTDEIEVYLGLINNDIECDPVVGAVEIDIELKGKIDILLNPGQQSLNSILDYLRENDQLDRIKEIEIKHQYDSGDALANELGSIAYNIADFIAEYGQSLEGLIEIEEDDVNPSKWAAYAFDSLRASAI